MSSALYHLHRLLLPKGETASRSVRAPQGNGAAAQQFVLDEGSPFDVLGASPPGGSFPRWLQPPHFVDPYRALILVAGERLMLREPIHVPDDARLQMRYGAGLPSISPDGLICEVAVHAADDHATVLETLALLPVNGGQQPGHWHRATLSLEHMAGEVVRLSVACLPGPLQDPMGDWLALAELCVGRADELRVLRARAHRAFRAENERRHFSALYRHHAYARQQDEQALAAQMGGPRARAVRHLSQESAGAEPAGSDAGAQLAHPLPDPLPGEVAYDYAMRLLTTKLQEEPVDFIGRLRNLADRHGRLRVLSLCSGAARIEAQMAAELGGAVHWSLLDLNADLLGLAGAQFPADVGVDLIEADVNELRAAAAQRWDVVLCVSALHHVVELEHLMAFCHASLRPLGEFWSIGEYVGRNGNRLWPEARGPADALFAELPERLRRNQHLGRVDTRLPDADCSVASFEGIRSEDILPQLARWFEPVSVYRRNCMLWRLMNMAYSDNYDLQAEEDRQWIGRAVQAELDVFRCGARTTELFGVFRPRTL